MAINEQILCGFCKRTPEEHRDSDAGPMTVCPPRRDPLYRWEDSVFDMEGRR